MRTFFFSLIVELFSMQSSVECGILDAKPEVPLKDCLILYKNKH